MLRNLRTKGKPESFVFFLLFTAILLGCVYMRVLVKKIPNNFRSRR